MQDKIDLAERREPGARGVLAGLMPFLTAFAG
jgi:hypothetical protein